MKAISAFPLLLIPVLIYNAVALGATFGLQTPDIDTFLRQVLFAMPMASGGRWTVSTSDLIVALSIVLLFFEVIKATSTQQISIVNHGLSMAVFIVCLVEFLLLAGFSTSTFFLLTLIALLDVLAGFIVTVITARKDFDLGGVRQG